MQTAVERGVRLLGRRTSFNLHQYGLHQTSRFEGFYFKFKLPSGASVIVIICTVPNAPHWPNSLSFTYGTKGGRCWQKEWKPDKVIGSTASAYDQGFTFRTTDDVAKITASSSCVEVTIRDATAGITFEARCIDRTPWSSSAAGADDGPEGWLSHLPLPLHWYVESLASSTSFSLSLPTAAGLAQEDCGGRATAHLEKNWGHRGGFPTAHMWVHAHDALRGRSLCLAGGRTMGVDAFLVGYRNSALNLDVSFRPPFSLKAFGVSPFMYPKVEWHNRSFLLSVSNMTHLISLWAMAPKESFFCFSAPGRKGHKAKGMAQSLKAEVKVVVYERESIEWMRALGVLVGRGKWKTVCEDVFEGAGLEFGGDYFGGGGSGGVDD